MTPTGTSSPRSAGLSSSSSTSIRPSCEWRRHAYTIHSMSEIGNSNSYGSVDKLVLELAAAYLTGGELALFTKMITALKDTKNSGAVKIFDSKAGYFNDASFQVGVAS